jgi:hypothetical protein
MHLEFVKLAACLGIITFLDYIFKIQVQFGFALALKKRLPLGYSLLPLTKLLLMLNVALSFFIEGNLPYRGIASWEFWWIMLSAASFALYGAYLYRKQMIQL